MTLAPGKTGVCCACLRRLTADEAKFYECRCEWCERRHAERVAKWWAGGADAELDAAFGAIKPIPQGKDS